MPLPPGHGRLPASAPLLHPGGRALRSCHPRDLVEQVVDMCRYQRTAQPVITRELLDAACRSYFLEESDSQGGEPR